MEEWRIRGDSAWIFGVVEEQQGIQARGEGEVGGEGGDQSGEDAETGEEEANLEGEAGEAGWVKRGQDLPGKVEEPLYLNIPRRGR
jgi:hypothetical protein